jgi:hypothetical protein
MTPVIPAKLPDPPLPKGRPVCGSPLPSWLSDSGVKGIQVVAVAHAEAQLADRWGDQGRQIVWDTSSAGFALVIQGGCAPVIARLSRGWNNPACRRTRRASQTQAFAGACLPAEPESGEDPPGHEFDPAANPDPRGPEPEPFPDYPPPGWGVGRDDRSFPGS